MRADQQLKETVDLRSYATLLWRRKWLIVIPTIAAGLTAFIVTLPAIMPPVYRCSATLLVEQPGVLSEDLQGLMANTSVAERLARLETQIQSAEFLTKIIENTGMRDDAETRKWAERNQSKYPDQTVEQLIDLKLLRYLRSSIQMQAGGANQIQVAAVDYDPDRCYRLVRNLTTGIIEANRASELEGFRTTEQFSSTQMNDYKRRLEEAENRLEAFRRNQAHRSAVPSLVGPNNLGRVQELQRMASNDLSMFGAEAAAAQSLLGGISTSSLDAILQSREVRSFLSEGDKLEQAYVRQSILDAERGGAAGQATAIQLSRVVSQLRAAVRDALANAPGLDPALQDAATDYLVARAQERFAHKRSIEFDRQVADFSNRIVSVPEADLELHRLQQEVDSYRTLMNVFEQQIVTSNISEAFEASQAGEQLSVLEPPQQPMKPVQPKRGPIIGLAFAAGLILGVLGCFVLEHHDPSFRDVKETEQRLGIRVIGTIPGIEAFAKNGDTRAAKEARQATAIRAVEEFLDDSPGYQEFRRTALGLLRSMEGGPRTLLITSARSAEGKSTASTCLALTLAKELHGERIALIDLDSRKPALANKLGLRVEPPDDASGVLRDRRWRDSAMQNAVLPNLFVMPMALVHEAPADLITQENVRWLLSELRQRFDRVIIDSPPNLPVPDPLVLGPEVDAVILVVKAGATPRETVQRSLDIQRSFGDNVWGVLMNNVGEALPYYYSYKHYGYGYRRKAR